MTIRIFNLLFFFAFLLSAAVQYNDPDATAWIATYLCASYMCFAQVRGHHTRWVPGILLVGCLAWIGLTLPALVGNVSWQEIVESISMKTREVEEAREIGGLALVAIWAAVLLVHNHRQIRAAP
jgi:hypothetical protein